MRKPRKSGLCDRCGTLRLVLVYTGSRSEAVPCPECRPRENDVERRITRVPANPEYEEQREEQGAWNGLWTQRQLRRVARATWRGSGNGGSVGDIAVALKRRSRTVGQFGRIAASAAARDRSIRSAYDRVGDEDGVK